MTHPWLPLTLAALAALLPPAAHAGSSRFGRCEVPPEVAAEVLPLPQLGQALASGRPVRVVVIGSTSSTGRGASSREMSYVRRLGAELERAWAPRRVEVIDRAAEGQTAVAMVARALPEVLRQPPPLVVWETGNTDSIRHLDPTDFGDALEAGIAALHAAGSDVILVTPQFSPATATLINFLDYRDIMLRVASSQSAAVLRRGEIMHLLFETGNFVIEPGADPKATTAAVDALNACLARLLATAIASGAAAP